MSAISEPSRVEIRDSSGALIQSVPLRAGDDQRACVPNLQATLVKGTAGLDYAEAEALPTPCLNPTCKALRLVPQLVVRDGEAEVMHVICGRCSTTYYPEVAL